jgi:uncharacterized protein YfaS (alpha-2-macroglobulin family)
MRKLSVKSVCVALLAVAAVGIAVVMAYEPYGYIPADRGQAAGVSGGDAKILPTAYLREYDPVTVFFERDAVPGEAGPIDAPGQLLSISPTHPGEYVKIDGRTLEFRPSAPWEPLKRYKITSRKSVRELFTLLPDPESVFCGQIGGGDDVPIGKTKVRSGAGESDESGDGDDDNYEYVYDEEEGGYYKRYKGGGSNGWKPKENLASTRYLGGAGPVKWVGFVFSTKVDPSSLSRLVSVEMCPLPGVGGKGCRAVRQSEYKVREDILGAKSFAYRVMFNEPVGYGQRVNVTLKFADKAEFKGAQETYVIETKPEFTLEKAGVYGQMYTLNANGVSYDARQAVKLGSDREFTLEFSSAPANPGISVLRSMVSVSPAPSDFRYRFNENKITIGLGMEQEKLYKVVLNPSAIKDAAGRPLMNKKPSSFYVYLPKVRPNAKWDHGFGIVERFGPQQFPITAAGISSLDFRVYKIDPQHTAFGDFPSAQIEVSETSMPPGPGEEPASMDSKYGESERWNYPSYVEKHIRMLGSPHYSGIVDLGVDGARKISTVDLKQMFAAVSGKDKPGTYLVGFRLLDGSQKRSYAKVTVTDLCLSAVESRESGNNRVLFAVTSYSSDKPVSDATIKIDGLVNDEMTTLAQGKTGSDGVFSFEHTKATIGKLNRSTVRRVVVSKGDDVLVINTEVDKDGTMNIFSDNHWRKSDNGWIWWPGGGAEFKAAKADVRGFVRAERPIYRPEDSVFIKGYVRELLYGAINLPAEKNAYIIKVRSPSSTYFERKVTLNEFGAFHVKVAPPTGDDVPTGTYDVSLYKTVRGEDEKWIAGTDFLVDAYRIPRFEVRVSGADRVPNDGPALVRATGTYYAGGRLVDRDVAWKVTAYPYDHTPRGFANYILSSDSRYGASQEPARQSVSEENGKTDGNGTAVLTLNPQAATAGNPTKYVVEATITDADMQTVSARHTVIALPPFILGVRANRHITSGNTISARIAAIGVKDSLIAGQKVTVELKRVTWASYLVDSDFSSGKPKYITNETVDLVEERSVVTEANPTAIEFKNQKPGVYVLALSSRDRLGRLQTVKIDLYLAGGEQQQAWKKAEQNVFETVMDRNSYEPGQQAKILLKSPYKKALALAITEMPNGELSYKWVNVENGQGTFTLEIKQEMAPRVPVSFLLMRPRSAAPRRASDGSSVDAGKPETVGNTTWLTVNPVANMLDIKLSHTSMVTPGSTLELTINLRDIQGKARPGEVALWLVDEAVLSLRKEHGLDPLEAFLKEVETHVSIADSRNLALGDLLSLENPGGDGEEEDEDGLGKITPRKNFKVVPYWNPSIVVDKNGTAVVKIQMSDDLTNYAIRAMAVSGPDRFGTAKSRVSVRLPVTIQPALPRFVRLGDKLRAGGIARVVEGGGGAATFMISAKGLSVKSSADKQIQLDAVKPMQLFSELAVETPPFTRRGLLQWNTVSVKMAVKRSSDNAGDAFEVKIPVLLDRQFIEETQFSQIDKRGSFSWNALSAPARPNTMAASLFVSENQYLPKIIAAVSNLVRFPYGCSEQVVSQSYPSVVYRSMWEKYGVESPDTSVTEGVNRAMAFLKTTQHSDGLFGYWPGTQGYVYLTAYVVNFLTEINAANKTLEKPFPFDQNMYVSAIEALKRSLRSDYSRFVGGQSAYERSCALVALARSGHTDIGYTRELAAAANELDIMGKTNVFKAIAEKESFLGKQYAMVEDQLWKSAIFMERQGKEAFGGFQKRGVPVGARMHASDAAALASFVSAMSASQKTMSNPRTLLMAKELMNMGADDGWGSTYANSMSLLALRDFIDSKEDGASTYAFKLNDGSDKPKQLTMKTATTAYWSNSKAGSVTPDGQSANRAFWVRLSRRYMPQALGSAAEPEQRGFAVKRGLIRIKKGAPPSRVAIDKGGATITVKSGDIVEEHVQIVNPEARLFVAVTVPLAAGFEPLNPRLENASSNAVPTNKTTNGGDYSSFYDDRVVYFFEKMEQGTYDFYFRSQAITEGEFSQPPARAEMMYQMNVFGASAGSVVVVEKQ